MNKIIIIGAFCEIIELCESLKLDITGIVDSNIPDRFMGYRILGTDNSAPYLLKEYGDIPILVSPDAPARRKALVDYYSRIGFRFHSVISPASSVSKYSKLGNGVVIQRNATVSTCVEVGDYVKINANATIMHESIIDDNATIAPNAVILGRVKIGNSSYIGANSTILSGLKIGDNCTVGAGAVVTKDVKPGVTVVGNPAREYHKEKI